MRHCFFIISLIVANCYSQMHPSTYYANTTSAHPLGVFISRVNNNFQLSADRQMSVTTSISSGNVWLPYVKAYNPSDEEDRLAIRNYIWHEREWNYDVENRPSETIEFHADGLIREYQVMFNFPIANRHEIKVNNRLFSIDAGDIPYSSLTSDQFIEWFHSNIYGGEDPFARKAHGFNQAGIRYKDTNGEVMQLNKGDFLFSGMEVSYYYYPDYKFLEAKNIYTNIGMQLGINTTKINPSVDLGLNFTLSKIVKLKNDSKELCLGISTSALRQNIIHFKNSVELSNKKYLAGLEFLLEYVKHFRNRSYFSLATTWFLQSSYNRKSDFDYLVLTGQRTTSHWHYAISHLYRKLSSNSLVFTYAKEKIAVWVYLKEDLLVDNAPDVQTGIGLRFYLK